MTERQFPVLRIPVLPPASAAEVARRRLLRDRILELRAQMDPLPVPVDELLADFREGLRR